MEVNKETKEDITRLQLMEQRLQTFSIQKQNFQTQLIEIDNALSELDTGKGDVYKIIGNVMLASNKEKLKKELKEKKELITLRIKNLEKQEQKTKEEANELQNKVMKKLQE